MKVIDRATGKEVKIHEVNDLSQTRISPFNDVGTDSWTLLSDFIAQFKRNYLKSLTTHTQVPPGDMLYYFDFPMDLEIIISGTSRSIKGKMIRAVSETLIESFSRNGKIHKMFSKYFLLGTHKDIFFSVAKELPTPFFRNAKTIGIEDEIIGYDVFRLSSREFHLHFATKDEDSIVRYQLSSENGRIISTLTHKDIIPNMLIEAKKLNPPQEVYDYIEKLCKEGM